MVRIDNNYQVSEINVHHFEHSTNTISPTDTNEANGLEYKVIYSDEYEIMSMGN
jgi:hypothetical protein